MEPVRTPDGRISVPQEVITSMEKNRVGLKGRYTDLTPPPPPPNCLYTYAGPLKTQIGKGAVSLNLTLRRYGTD